MKRLPPIPALAVCITLLPSSLHGQSEPVKTLQTLTVYGESEDDGIIQNPFPDAVEGQKIFAGKRATVIDLDALPKVQANNYRQALAMTPGLLYSEETTPLVSLGFRGIGTPDRAQFLQVLKDGIPIHCDPFGYPEAYYTPPLDVVDRIEFIRGGGGLMYGSQPAGVLNYVTHMPVADRPAAFRTQNIFGSFGFYSNYTSFSGTSGNTGYYGYYNHRQSDGFRDANSQYRLDGGLIKLAQAFSKDTRLVLSLDLYDETHGEPGGLSLDDWKKNPNQISRPNDHFALSRYAISADLQHHVQTGTDLSVKTWFAYMDRQSWRQQGGSFGIKPENNPDPKVAGFFAYNKIEHQRFYSFGFEPRIRHDWEAFGGNHTLTAGFQIYQLHSPREDREGQTPTALAGILRNSKSFNAQDTDRDVTYLSAFAENKFTWGDISITPGIRFERIRQSVDSKTWKRTDENALTGVGSLETDSVTKTDHQPLLGLGVAYELPRQQQLYINVSQSYRPTIFSQSIVAAPGTTTTDASPCIGWSYEIGSRGRPLPWLIYDTSLFVVDLDNRFGLISGQLGSVGRTINYGWDISTQVDLIGIASELTGRNLNAKFGNLNLYASATILEAEIYGGINPTTKLSNDGVTPMYAPNYMVRTGLIYGIQKAKISFLGTMVGQHKASDDNAPKFVVPSYVTWDLTAEIPVTKRVSVMAGVNNVFDKQYYSRITTAGIDPSYGRNVYAGFSLQF
jgi:Fe(3+) dicitrate transport protein